MTTATNLIELSITENRTVTEYPATQEEYDALLDDLLSASDGEVDTAERLGRVIPIASLADLPRSGAPTGGEWT